MEKYWGKYRGKVVNNKDKDKIGRLEIKIPLLKEPVWAMPCVPYAGKNVGFLAIPPKDANVWVEFESGDVNHPIWTGCFWSKNTELPQNARKAPEKTKIFRTGSTELLLDDTSKPGSIKLNASPNAKDKPILQLNSDGIKLELEKNITIDLAKGAITIKKGSKSIKVTGSNVTINNGALEVL